MVIKPPQYNYFRDYNPNAGLYVQSDPVGLGGGSNTYGYVYQSPMLYIDPRGLVVWKGSSSTVAAVVGGGAVRYRFDLKSDCVDGVEAEVSVVAGGTALGLGAEIAGTASKVEFEDDNSVPDPSVFQGQALYAGIGHAFIGIGYQVSVIKLGEAWSIGGAHQVGWDASVLAGAGISTVVSSKITECECDD